MTVHYVGRLGRGTPGEKMHPVSGQHETSPRWADVDCVVCKGTLLGLNIMIVIRNHGWPARIISLSTTGVTTDIEGKIGHIPYASLDKHGRLI